MPPSASFLTCRIPTRVKKTVRKVMIKSKTVMARRMAALSVGRMARASSES